MGEVKIQNLIDEAIESGVSAWIEYPGIDGFVVKVGFVGKEELFKITDESKMTIWVKHRREEKVDRTKLTKRWAKKAILDWKGLTLGTLRELIPIKVKASEEKVEVPCDEENKFSLLYNSTDFDVWLTEVSTSPEYFVEEKKKKEVLVEELKNS